MRRETVTCDECKANHPGGPDAMSRWLRVVLNGWHRVDADFCSYACLAEWARRSQEQYRGGGTIISQDAVYDSP